MLLIRKKMGWFVRYGFLFVAVTFNGIACSATDDAKLTTDLLDEVLVVHKKEKYLIFQKLDAIREKSKDRIGSYVFLLDYYIGSATGLTLDQYITEEGKTAIPSLENKKKLPINCPKKYRKLCEKKTERDERIDFLIDSIKNGKILWVD